VKKFLHILFPQNPFSSISHLQQANADSVASCKTRQVAPIPDDKVIWERCPARSVAKPQPKLDSVRF